MVCAQRMTEQFLESLEQRIAPATLINPKTVEFTDAEGDIVHVTVSKGELSLSNFSFTALGEGRETLDTLTLGSIFSGTNLTVSVFTAGSGEGSGHAEIGSINAANIKLGTVAIAGDLGTIDAGDGKVGIKSLSVDSLGTLTPADFNLTDRTSDVSGAISSLTIAGDFGGTLNVTGGKKGTLGTLIVGGSLTSGAGDIAGYIHTTGAIKSASITGSIDGSHADTANEAGVVSDLGIKSISVGGAVLGGGFKNTGVIIAGLADASTGLILKGTTKISTVTIGEDVIGGAGKYSGAIIGWAGLGTVTVGGKLTGGTGEDSGTIQAGGITVIPTPNPDPTKPQSKSVIAGGNLGEVSIGGDVTGNDGVRSAAILSWGAVTEKGKTIGGSFGDVHIEGSLTGGDGQYSALVYGYAGLKNAMVTGDLIGGEGDDSGRIATDAGPLGTVHVGGDLKGGAGVESGTIFAGNEFKQKGKPRLGNIGSVFIGGEILGGGDQDAGSVWADNNIGTITVKEGMTGGTTNRTGNIIALGSVKTIDIGGTVTGKNFDYTGVVLAQHGIGEINITGSLIGGNNTIATDPNGSIHTGRNTGAIIVGSYDQGVIFGSIGKLSIGGDIKSGEVMAGKLQDSGAVRVNGYIGEMSVGGSLIGNETMPVWITALANPGTSVMNNVALKSLSVGENVDHALILAGVLAGTGDPLQGATPGARIGDVTVGGDWTASSLAAGVKAGADGYGAGDTPSVNIFTGITKWGLSKINSLTIVGEVHGGAEGDQYGFAAQSFGSITIDGVAQTIPAVDATQNVTPDGSVKIHTVKKA